jgi:hypothetical protein
MGANELSALLWRERASIEAAIALQGQLLAAFEANDLLQASEAVASVDAELSRLRPDRGARFLRITCEGSGLSPGKPSSNTTSSAGIRWQWASRSSAATRFAPTAMIPRPTDDPSSRQASRSR